MKLLIYVYIVLFSLSSFAKIDSYFPITGAQAVINMKTKAFMQEDDPSPEKLFRGMDVPPKNSIGGNGKKIESYGQYLTIICADQGQGQFFCNITVKKSNICQINRSSKQVKCALRGANAYELFNKFHTDQKEYFYQNETGELAIQAHPEQFVLKYTDWE